MAYDIGPKIGIDGEADFRNSIKAINENMKTLGTEMKAVVSQFEKGDESEEALTAKNKVLSKEIEEQTGKIEKLKEGLQAATQKYGETDAKTQGWQRSVNTASAKLNDLTREITSNSQKIENIKKGYDSSSDSVENFSDEIGEAGKNTLKFGDIVKANLISDTILSGVDKLVNGIKELAKSTVGFALGEQTSAVNQFSANTGLANDQLEKYKGVMNQIYSDNYGENFNEVSDALKTVRQQIGGVVDGWSTDGVKDFTESTLALKDTFGYDVNESVRAADAMMKNFGIDGDEALSMIAAGTQNGLDFSGELLDSISEYSPQFAKVGFDAYDMFNVFQTGADTGAWNLDKIGDAVKEFSIRTIDGSNTTQDGFNRLGLNAKEMGEKFAAGGDTAKEAFKQVVNGLADMQDPVAQNTAGIDLFGTMWEDLGPNVVTQLANIKDSTYDTKDAMEQIKNVKYDDIGSALQGLGREIQVQLADKLNENLSPIVQNLIDYLQENGPQIADTVSQIATKAGEFISFIIENAPVIIPLIAGIGGGMAAWNVAQMIQGVVEAIKAFKLANEGASVAQALLNGVMNANPIMLVITAIMAIVTALGVLYATNEDFRNAVNNIMKDIWNVVSGVVEGIGNFFTQTIPNAAGSARDGIVNGFNAAIDFIKGIPGAIGDVLGNFGNMALDWGKDLIDGLVNGIKNGIGKVGDAAKGVASKITSFLHFSVPDEGPLTEYESWMPDFMNGLAEGIDKNKGRVTDSIKNLAENMRNGLDTPQLEISGTYGMETSIRNAKQSDNAGLTQLMNLLEKKDIKFSIDLSLITDGKELAKTTVQYMQPLLDKREKLHNRIAGG